MFEEKKKNIIEKMKDLVSKDEETDYEKLEKKFERDVENLQAYCDHEDTKWIEKMHTMRFASTGNAVLKCVNCRKDLDMKPIEEVEAMKDNDFLSMKSKSEKSIQEFKEGKNGNGNKHKR